MDIDPRHYDHVAINDNDVNDVIVAYLIHNCYKETAESFINCSGMKQPVGYIDDMDKRKRIISCVLDDHVLEAIELTDELSPHLFEENKEFHFDLLSLHFVSLVRSKQCTEALEFAQNKLTPFGKMEKYVSKLEDFLALLAYDEPDKSPVFHLLSSDYRQRVAENLNRAILVHANMPSYTAMEKIVKQTTVVRKCLSQENKDGIPPFSLKDFLRS